MELSGFPAYPDGSPSQLIRISGVILYYCECGNLYPFSLALLSNNALPAYTAKACPGSKTVARLIFKLDTGVRYVFNVTSRPCEGASGIRWVGIWVGPGAGLVVLKKSKFSCRYRERTRTSRSLAAILIASSRFPL
jgi:hypothetical protein